MKATYSASSQMMALAAPKPMTRPASCQLASCPRGTSRPAPADNNAQLKKWFASSPPLDGVVEIGGVAGDVDEERRGDQDVGDVWEGARAREEVPRDREHHDGDRVGDQAATERFALELLQAAERAEGEEPDERELEGDIGGEHRGSVVHRRESRPDRVSPQSAQPTAMRVQNGAWAVQKLT